MKTRSRASPSPRSAACSPLPRRPSLKKRESWEVYPVRNRTVLASKGKGEKIIVTRYFCLPNSTDPRGPKGN